MTATPGAMLTKNSQRQEAVSAIQPPMVGPRAGARVEMTPSTAVAMASRRPLKKAKPVAKTSGIIAPPTKPCTARNTAIETRSLVRPQARLARVNRPAERANSHRLEIASARKAESGIMTISAIR